MHRHPTSRRINSLTHDHSHHHQHADGSDCHCDPETDAVTALDPICGMTIDKGATDLTAEYQGQTYYFCSASCRATFLADPAAYTGHGPAA
jgi:P-type Cu+ transporter